MSFTSGVLLRFFTPNLLSYAFRFITLYENVNLVGTHSINFRWFYKVSYLVRHGVYIYKKYKKVYFSYSRYYVPSFSILRLKVIELSFCFLVISFCKIFLFERLTEWV